MSHPIPANEPERLAALQALNILYSPTEERYDRITRLAQRMLDAPMALVSFVGDEFQWFKSAQGISESETPREISFCAHAIMQDEVFVVEDALLDPRFSDNPLVTGNTKIRFYAGYPIRAANGSRIGALCVLDRRPRVLSPEDEEVLRDLAACVETELHHAQLGDAHRTLLRERDLMTDRAAIDPVTHIWNRTAIMELLRAELARARRGNDLCVAVVSVDNFSKIQESYGLFAAVGVLVELPIRIRNEMREYDVMGRMSEHRFMVVLGGCGIDAAHKVCDRIRAVVSSAPFETAVAPVMVTVSIGLVEFQPHVDGAEEMMKAAEQAMLKALSLRGNRTEMWEGI